MSDQPIFHLLCQKWCGDGFNLEGIKHLSPNEIVTFLFEEGMKLLARNMPIDFLSEGAGDAFLQEKEEANLYQALHVDNMKEELETVRQTGDVSLIARKECELADTIQMAVSLFPFVLSSCSPREILQNKGINCRGASVLGGALLTELGISYLVGDVPYHSILILIPSDGTMEWRDMSAPRFNERLSEEMLGDSYYEALAFVKNPAPEGLMLDVLGDSYREKLSWVKKRQRQFLTLFPSILGLQMQVLNGVAYQQAYFARGESDMSKKAEYFDRSLQIYQLALAYEPNYEYAYNGMGDVLYDLNRYEEALLSYEKSQTINPASESCYYGIGNAHLMLGYREEALSAYKTFFMLADRERFSYWISESRKRIIELSRGH